MAAKGHLFNKKQKAKEIVISVIAKEIPPDDVSSEFDHIINVSLTVVVNKKKVFSIRRAIDAGVNSTVSVFDLTVDEMKRLLVRTCHKLGIML